jgi:hypothetical protein
MQEWQHMLPLPRGQESARRQVRHRARPIPTIDTTSGSPILVGERFAVYRSVEQEGTQWI